MREEVGTEKVPLDAVDFRERVVGKAEGYKCCTIGTSSLPLPSTCWGRCPLPRNDWVYIRH